MVRFLVYIFFVTGTLYIISWLAKRPMTSLPSLPKPTNVKPGRWFRPKRNPGEIWVQVYETASVEEGRKLQARLEEEVECVLYEQGKKDIYGSALKGIGIAVPKTTTALAQNIISRLLA